MSIDLEIVAGTNATYTRIREKHYIADHGAIGRRLRYLIHYDGRVAGIIEGGMSALAGKQRDKFFGLDLAKRFDDYYADEHEGLQPMRLLLRNGCVINNTIFRLTYHEHGLASRVLAVWRKRVAEDWLTRYDREEDRISILDERVQLPVLGFETYIVPYDHGNGKRRDGVCYRADNWKHVGNTSTGKLLYCRKNENWRSMYSGRECLMNHELAALFQMIYDATTDNVPAGEAGSAPYPKRVEPTKTVEPQGGAQ